MEKTELITMNKEEIVSSVLIPEEFKKSPKDVIIAVDFAKRQGRTIGDTLLAFNYALKFQKSPLNILQNMYDYKGKIGFYSDFIFSILKTLYKELDFVWKDRENRANMQVKLIGVNENGETFESEFCHIKCWAKETDIWKSIPETMLKRKAIKLFATTNNPEIFGDYSYIEEPEDNKEMKNITEPIEVKPEIKPTIIEATVENVENNNNNKKNRF